MFCPDAIQPYTSVYIVFCCVNAIYTAHATKQHIRLCRGFSCDCTRSTAHYTKPTQAAIIPPVPRWRAYQRIQDITAAPGRCIGQHRPPIIIRYIRGRIPAPYCRSMPDSAAYRGPCKRRRVSVSTCAVSALRLEVWHRVSSQGGAGQSSGRRRGGRRGTIGGYRRISFRAVAR